MVAEQKKRELMLDGLSCARCSSAIESKIKQIDGVENAEIDFIHNTLSIEIDREDRIESILESSRKIIKSIEPEIVIREKRVEKTRRKIYFFMGLCCSSCASKIEESVGKIDGVQYARVDFGRGELLLDVHDEKKTSAILKESQKRARRIVRGVRVRAQESDRRTPAWFRYALLALGVVLFIIALSQVFKEISLPVYLASYLCFGHDVLFRAGKNILHGKIFDENLLMSIATIGAFVVQAWPEAVSVMLFYKIGMLLQDRAVNRSKRSIQALLGVRPEYANKKTSDGFVRVMPDEVEKGDHIIVMPGERIPLDGVVVKGNSFVDTSLVTGESVPQEKTTGSEVLSGSINTSGVIQVLVEKTFANSAALKIVEFVKEANKKKSRAEHFISIFTRYYTPVVVGAAVLLAVLPPLVTGQAFTTWLYRALIFLVISCPCALVLSIPLTFSAGIGRLARSGILVKGAQYVETLRRVKTVVFDKTGTLTEGLFEVVAVRPTAPYTARQCLGYAAIAEAYSNHPAAMAIRTAFGEKIPLERVELYDEIAGMGVRTQFEGKKILVGSRQFLEHQGVAVAEGVELDEENTADSGKSPVFGALVFVAVENDFAGLIVISDKIKANAAETLEELSRLGVTHTVMLSGDQLTHALAVGRRIGITDVRAPLLPEDKVRQFDLIKKNELKKNTVLYVGDGINDAPLLARADIGAAMGGLGRDAAIEVSDMVIVDDNLHKLPAALRIARKTHRIVIQNVTLAFGVKVLVLALGALGLATMWQAVFADVGVALLAVGNALRILRSGRYRRISSRVRANARD